MEPCREPWMGFGCARPSSGGGWGDQWLLFLGVFQAPGEPQSDEIPGWNCWADPKGCKGQVRVGSSGLELPWAEGFGFPWVLRNLLVWGRSSCSSRNGCAGGWEGRFSHQEFQKDNELFPAGGSQVPLELRPFISPSLGAAPGCCG